VKAAFPQAQLFKYEAAGADGSAAASKAVLGAGVKPFVKLGSPRCAFSRSTAISSVLILSPANRSLPTQSIARRKSKVSQADMNRLYVLENRYTLTGGMADHRKAIPASLIPAVGGLSFSVELGDSLLPKLWRIPILAPLKEWIKLRRFTI
jgi:hypothetical protein